MIQVTRDGEVLYEGDGACVFIRKGDVVCACSPDAVMFGALYVNEADKEAINYGVDGRLSGAMYILARLTTALEQKHAAAQEELKSASGPAEGEPEKE